MDQDEPAAPEIMEATTAVNSEPSAEQAQAAAAEEPPSEQPELSIPTNAQEVPMAADILDESLQPPPPMDTSIGELSVHQNEGGGIELSLEGLGPDGTLPGDLTQLQPEDGLLGGTMMDQSGDPFSEAGMNE